MTNWKEAGSDGINAELLKYGGENRNNRLLNCINLCWRCAEIPETWYQVHVVSTFKKEKRNYCSSYRGINLLNAGHEVYTKVINARLQIIMQDLSLEDKFGFRKGRSCTDVFTLNQITKKEERFGKSIW
jgi:hypothetical protein